MIVVHKYDYDDMQSNDCPTATVPDGKQFDKQVKGNDLNTSNTKGNYYKTRSGREVRRPKNLE